MIKITPHHFYNVLIFIVYLTRYWSTASFSSCRVLPLKSPKLQKLKQLFKSNTKNIFKFLLKRACHICYSIKIISVKYRYARSPHDSSLQIPLLDKNRQYCCKRCYWFSQLVSLWWHYAEHIATTWETASVQWCLENCAMCQLQHSCSMVFKMKGLNKLRSVSLKKECSAILDFNKKI